MSLHGNIDGTESAGDLFKPSKDLASLRVCNEKMISVVQIFCEWRYKWRTFRPPWPISTGPGPKLLDGSISLKFLFETRLKSESFDTLYNLLGSWVQIHQTDN